MSNYVYVIHDPLYEKVLCVHDKPNGKCNTCKPIRNKCRGAYQLQEVKRKVKKTK